jgi:hypothetical protein
LTMADDDAWLDGLRYMIYRDRAKRYTGIAVRRFRTLIKGCDFILKGERLSAGYHKDRIYPIRAAFENDIPACVAGLTDRRQARGYGKRESDPISVFAAMAAGRYGLCGNWSRGIRTAKLGLRRVVMGRRSHHILLLVTGDSFQPRGTTSNGHRFRRTLDHLRCIPVDRSPSRAVARNAYTCRLRAAEPAGGNRNISRTHTRIERRPPPTPAPKSRQVQRALCQIRNRLGQCA